MRARVVSFLPVAVLAASSGCSSDQRGTGKDAGAQSDAAPSREAGTSDRGGSAGAGGAKASSGGASPGGRDASSGGDLTDAAAGSAGQSSRDASLRDSGAMRVPEAGTPVSGTVNGNTLDFLDSFSILEPQEEFTFLRVNLVNFADACNTQLAIVRNGIFHQSSMGMYLAVAIPGPDTPIGAYEVNATVIVPPSRFGPTVYAGYAHNDDQCAERDLDSLYGTVVFREVTDQHVEGAFDVTFANGHMSGAFDAPRCDALIDPGSSDAGPRGCFP